MSEEPELFCGALCVLDGTRCTLRAQHQGPHRCARNGEWVTDEKIPEQEESP
jgi:hypothetical protein